MDDMACVDVQNVVRLGVVVYDSIVRVEDACRQHAFDDPPLFTTEHAAAFRELKKSWLKACARVERKIRRFEAKGYAIDDAAELRRQVEECRWLTAPPAKAFAAPKVVKLRDAALDERRPRRGSKRPRHGG
jgi:hypothetical protein